MRITIPDHLAASCAKAPERVCWLDRLPSTVHELERRWAITIGEAFDSSEGSCAWVATATRSTGQACVLKLGLPHMEGMHEIAGLRFWDGDPTVRLLEADEQLGAMLLERCQPGSTLREQPEPEQDVLIADLLTRLWRAPGRSHPFRPLSDMVAFWSAETMADEARWGDPGIVREGLRLFRELLRSAPTETLLATDLHAGNVLRAERAPWLVIDPKPFVGDPAYDATQHLLNCTARLSANPDGTIARFADLLGVDRARVRLWTFARVAAEPRDDWKDEARLSLARKLAP